MTHEHIEQAIAGLGRGIAEEALVNGSTAIAYTLPQFRHPVDIDITVPADAFTHLREQGDWEEAQSFDGTPRLLKDGLDIGTDWGITADYNKLVGRSWKSASGIRVAGLPDVYAYKHRRRQGNDLADLQVIQSYLHDPNRTPFSANQLPHELAMALDCLSPELQDNPDAERAALLAANGIHIVNTLYGHPSINQANQILGNLELSEFGVPATYHNGFGLIRDAKALQQHLYNIGASPHDHLLALAIDPYTDAIYGNGRFSDDPESHDERRSAELLQGHALQLGFSAVDSERMRDITLATTFDEKTKSQRGKHATDPLARAVAGVDLHPLSQPESVKDSFSLAVEDGFSARFNRARTIGRVLTANHVRIYTTLGGLHAIDNYAHERPADAPDGPTVIEALSNRLSSNADFHRMHEYTDGWTLDNPRLRHEHANMLEHTKNLLIAGKTAVDIYLDDVERHTVLMQERYGDE